MYWKKGRGRKVFKEVSRKGNFVTMSDGNVFHKRELKGATENEFRKGNPDEGVGIPGSSNRPGATEGTTGDRVRTHNGGDGFAGENGVREAEPEVWGSEGADS